MLTFQKNDVVTDPFPHIISPSVLDPSFYQALRKDFPSATTFDEQKQESGVKGSRTGQGFDIYRGDQRYDDLVKSSEAWREFDAFINSPRFVEKFLELFGDYLDEFGINCDISPDQYDRDNVEGREVLTPKETLGDSIQRLGRIFTGGRRSAENVGLFTRLDIHKALTGYAKAVHCDRPNRLCSLIIYFCDAEKAGLKGGDLTIHKHVENKKPTKYERHPKAEDAPVIATLRPKENLGVFFPCCNNSYHGVTAVETPGVERDYLYINISGDTKSLW
jgi:hypothetical protein